MIFHLSCAEVAVACLGGRQSSTIGQTVSTGRRRPLREVLQALALSALVLGFMPHCAAEAPILPPLGRWDVPVGTTWSQVVTARSGSPGDWQWRVVAGPGNLLLVAKGPQAQLFWTPTVFDLAPTAAGKPRLPGEAQALHIEATDSQGDRATALGSLRAVPPLL